MRILFYNDLDLAAIPGFAKVRQALEAGNFIQADVRKIGDNLYRARLNKRDRLLFSLHKYQGEQCALVLEHIANHAYDRSRFLAGGAEVDETKIPAVEAPEVATARHRLSICTGRASAFTCSTRSCLSMTSSKPSSICRRRS